MKTMNALVYRTAHPLEGFDLKLAEVPYPQPQDTDLVVRVRAVSLNPVDTKIRKSRTAPEGQSVILGWDAAGEVVSVGSKVQGFAVGDRVFYAGDLTRNGSYAEYQAVDFRIAARMPKSLGFAESAALALTGLTAWESLFEILELDRLQRPNVLIWGGAGGVGSIATQLLKAKTDARVVTTASRPESAQFSRDMGADLVVDYTQDFRKSMQDFGVEAFDAVFGTTGSVEAIKTVPTILRPFGSWVTIDAPDQLDVSAFKLRSQSVRFELMFTKPMFGFRIQSQGAILSQIAQLVDAGKLRTTAQVFLRGLNAETFLEGHRLVESGRTIGKIVIEY